ncbi:hypothetical protein TSMEX_007555 [Taenia solium]|eukprot:TsM_001040800 transcript=TsM_001040800 gene=TsM_001040800
MIDCMTGQLLKYAQENGEKFNVLGIGNLVRSCPFSLNKTARDGKPTYTIDICFNVTRLALAPPSGFPQLVAIGRAKFDASVEVIRGDHPQVKLALAAPVFDEAAVYVTLFPLPRAIRKAMIKTEGKQWIGDALGVPIPAYLFKGKIIEQIRGVLEGQLKALLTNLG